MNQQELNFLHIFHVAAVLVLVGYTFFAFAGPAETRKRVLMITGIASLVVLLTGIRMWQGKYAFHPYGWVIVKGFCWLGLSAISGMAYRKRDQVNLFMVITLVLALVALVMVYTMPF